MVVLLTTSGQSSAYVQQEIGAAKMANKPIIPLVQPGTKPDLAMLEGVEYIPFDFLGHKKPSKPCCLTCRSSNKRRKINKLLLGLGSLILLGLFAKK